jgi:protein-disulfide isomerase
MKAVKPLAIVPVAVVALIAGSTGNVNGNEYGDRKAPVTIEVFSDFQCPGCKAFHDNEFQRIMTDYVVPGKVYVIYRYFPLQMHPYGRPCAEYACAAARVGRYQKVADVLFAQQAAIAASGKVEEAVASVLTPTEMKTVKSLLKSPEVQREIQADLDEGPQVPVAGTPTFWVTHRGKSQAVSWPLNYSLFKSYVEGLLAK